MINYIPLQWIIETLGEFSNCLQIPNPTINFNSFLSWVLLCPSLFLWTAPDCKNFGWFPGLSEDERGHTRLSAQCLVKSLWSWLERRLLSLWPFILEKWGLRKNAEGGHGRNPRCSPVSSFSVASVISVVWRIADKGNNLFFKNTNAATHVHCWVVLF